MEVYPEYKDSGVSHLGTIPSHWNALRNKLFFHERKEIVGGKHNEYRLLSLTLNGIIYRDLDNAQGKFPADFSTYQAVYPGDFVFCFFDVDETPRTVGLSSLSGMITGAYTVLTVVDMDRRYLYYYYLSVDNQKGLRPLYRGLRKTVPFDSFMASRIPVPPLSEQQQIASYLDWQSSKINKFIKAKKKLISLLKEQKQNIINEAVTKGINPDVKMKDSGVEWLGDIPEHWMSRRAKYLFKIEDLRSKTGKEELLSVSHLTGVTPRSQKSINMFLAESYVGSKICKPGFIAINTMWAWMASIGVSKYEGIISSSYHTYSQRKNIFNDNYLDVFLRSSPMKSAYTVNSSGITSSRMRLYPDDFLRLHFIYPPMSEQIEILTYIEKETALIEEAISRAEREIELIQEYRTRLVSDVITGKVDVRSIEIPDFEIVEADVKISDDEESEEELISEAIEG